MSQKTEYQVKTDILKSVQLISGYPDILILSNTPRRIRTYNPLIKNQLLYQVELAGPTIAQSIPKTRG